ncbi:hypothetical protein VNO80_25226 [Phaseolus coccineus]|uniref:Uncharacterized protein n=1 Tax=Phaseolus coccineus TaxID=3886 RepID=A0AAN9LXF0_PHACN
MHLYHRAMERIHVKQSDGLCPKKEGERSLVRYGVEEDSVYVGFLYWITLLTFKTGRGLERLLIFLSSAALCKGDSSFPRLLRRDYYALPTSIHAQSSKS